MRSRSSPIRGLRSSIFLLFAVLGGCDRQLTRYQDYHGEGTFVGHAAPVSLCQDGYTVDLGALDLTNSEHVERRLEGLPSIEATIGVAIAPKPYAPWQPSVEMPRPATLVTITLRDDKDHIVLSRHERLSEWIRQFPLGDPQHAYLYVRGNIIDVATGPGSVHTERFPIGEDESWGTYFTPRRGARYTLHFTVDEPDANAASLDARLEVRGVVGCL